MASNKAYYWLALAVLALGLNNEYQSGRMQPLHNLVNRSAMTVNCFALRAHEFVALARVLMGGSATAPENDEWANALRNERVDRSDLRTELDLRQRDLARLGTERAQMVRMAADMARHQAEFARLQAQRSRVIVRAGNIRKSVTCNNGEFRVSVDTDMDDAPNSDLPDTF